ncbi:hypothetical protein [Bacillus solimangrovi]|uniref:hypothetical protein n=1 Tax=Bacillus solimangrovi TaxID=1305675 RepID=UPI001586ABF2|nr:hypothetical protein [Bacillus solimangrovi]
MDKLITCVAILEQKKSDLELEVTLLNHKFSFFVLIDRIKNIVPIRFEIILVPSETANSVADIVTANDKIKNIVPNNIKIKPVYV